MHKKFIKIAKIGSTHGLKGDMNLYSLANPVEELVKYGQWHIRLKPNSDWMELKNEKIFKRAKKFYIHLDGVDYIDDAKAYVNAMIGVPEDALPDLAEDEHYWKDIIGLEVVNSKNDSFGVVKDILETGYNDVLVCKKGKEEYLIPYVKKHVLDLSLSEKQILVDWEYDY